MDGELSIPSAEDGKMAEEEASKPSLFTGLKITSALAAIGGVCGAGAGIVLTYLGNVISGYPIPPSAGIYAWNAGTMALIGATLGPPVAWAVLRTVPLWRTLLEPAAAGVVAGVLSMLFAPSLFGIAVPFGIFGAALRLGLEYRKAEGKALAPEGTKPRLEDDESGGPS